MLIELRGEVGVSGTLHEDGRGIGGCGGAAAATSCQSDI